MRPKKWGLWRESEGCIWEGEQHDRESALQTGITVPLETSGPEDTLHGVYGKPQDRYRGGNSL